MSCLSGPGGLSCHRVLSCLSGPGGLLIPPHFPREIFWGGIRVPVVGAGPRGLRPRAPKTICHGLQCSQLRHGPQSSHVRHGPQSSQLRHGPQSSQLYHGPQSSQLHHGLQSSLHRHGFQSSQLRHGPCLSVLLWRSPSCVPVCVCPEGPPELPPPLPDGTVKARDEPFGRGELCQSSVVCVMCPHLMFPYLVCFLSLFNVIISSFMSSRVCLIIYDLPVYISSCLLSLILSGLLVIPGVSCLVLSCPALKSLLNIIIWVYILVRVFLFLPRVCTVTIFQAIWINAFWKYN